MSEYICPHCGKPVNDDDALLCLYCGKNLNRSVGFMGRIKYLKQRIVMVAFIAMVLLSFILLMSC